MKTWYENEPEQLMNDAEVAQLGAAYEDDDELKAFFASLQLLEGVPIDTLFPDERLLPPESLRFFYVDPVWMDSFIDGARSIGRTSTADARMDACLRERAIASSYTVSLAVRAKKLGAIRGVTRNVALAAEGIRTGFALRSEIVRGWPGCEVRCFAGTAELSILRLTVLGGEVLLCLVEGEPDTVELTEPAESLIFGFAREGVDIVSPLVSLKTGEEGKPIPNAAEKAVFRNGVPGVLDVKAFADQMQKTLTSIGKHRSTEPFSALELGVEMVRLRTRAKIQMKRGVPE